MISSASLSNQHHPETETMMIYWIPSETALLTDRNLRQERLLPDLQEHHPDLRPKGPQAKAADPDREKRITSR